jgi:hypothetical protein
MRRSGMRVSLACTLLLLGSMCGASGAGAFGLSMAWNPASKADPDGVVGLGETVILDIYLDADPGLEAIAVAVLFDDDDIGFNLDFQPGASSLPSYILYTGGKGATYLQPLHSHRGSGVAFSNLARSS